MNDRTGTRLEWVQPQWTKRHYELRGGGSTVASLRISGTLKNDAQVDADGASYQFARSGFIHKKITITRSPFDQDVGTMILKWNGTGTMSLNDGRTYELSLPSLWKNSWRVLDHRGDQIAQVTLRSGLVRNRGEVVVTGALNKEPHLGMVLALAWYAIVLTAQDAAAGAAAGA